MPTVTKADENVAERAQVVFDAVAEVASADHHAGDERADRQGEAGEICEIGGSEGHEKRRQKEQLARAGPRRAGKHRPDKRAGDDGDGREGDCRPPETLYEIEGIDGRLSRPVVHGDEQGNRRDILEQQDADGETAMLAGDLALLGELLHGDSGRRHRRSAAQQDGEAELEPKPP
jgi:hypothetical protein